MRQRDWQVGGYRSHPTERGWWLRPEQWGGKREKWSDSGYDLKKTCTVEPIRFDEDELLGKREESRVIPRFLAGRK